MNEENGLSRQQMCDRLAREFADGWIVNLGVGIPTMCSNADFGDRVITFHAENGVIGYGPIAEAGHEDRHLVNAGLTALPERWWRRNAGTVVSGIGPRRR